MEGLSKLSKTEINAVRDCALDLVVERTNEYHDGFEEGKSEEFGGLVHKGVVWIVLRVHLRTKCNTGNYVHCEAAETPAKKICIALLKADHNV